MAYVLPLTSRPQDWTTGYIALFSALQAMRGLSGRNTADIGLGKEFDVLTRYFLPPAPGPHHMTPAELADRKNRRFLDGGKSDLRFRDWCISITRKGLVDKPPAPLRNVYFNLEPLASDIERWGTLDAKDHRTIFGGFNPVCPSFARQQRFCAEITDVPRDSFTEYGPGGRALYLLHRKPVKVIAPTKDECNPKMNPKTSVSLLPLFPTLQINAHLNTAWLGLECAQSISRNIPVTARHRGARVQAGEMPCCICGGSVQEEHTDFALRWPRLTTYICQLYRELDAQQGKPTNAPAAARPNARLAAAASVFAEAIERDEVALSVSRRLCSTLERPQRKQALSDIMSNGYRRGGPRVGVVGYILRHAVSDEGTISTAAMAAAIAETEAAWEAAAQAVAAADCEEGRLQRASQLTV
ncbi:hypothetical protein J3E69DRAFT_372812 [Trichoderma sp. SZMC 28015]